MNSSSVIFGLYVFCIMANVGHCDTIAFEPGTITYSWIIPPKSRPPSDRPSSIDLDTRNESPIRPIGGYGHPPFYLRHSQEQLTLPNEFLITPGDPHSRASSGLTHQPPLFQQLNPNKPLMNQADCDGDPTCPNVDITQQQHATTMHQSNIAAVPNIMPPVDSDQRQRGPISLGQPVSWPTTHSGGIGLLFFVPQSASHLPVEQLIRQQLLALHRTQFPFDISINCEDAVGSGAGCLPGGRSPHPPQQSLLMTPPPPFSPATTTLNGRNVENGNYASLPLFEIVNSSSRRGGGFQEQQQQNERNWRPFGENIVRRLLQQQRELSIKP
ncbi:uncharacterized protein LOC129907379 [Episyrphus balteatus]|uniref:uncharacterized protein LOC129907379 n=1 Tax=Episyrphus balteatus TaxID=286459 RepID=UPI002485CAC4|nr:uncharacterized protein LOC129907379 [Episyrphus balteatus]